MLVRRSGNTPLRFIGIDLGACIAAPVQTHFLLIDQSRRVHAEGKFQIDRDFALDFRERRDERNTEYQAEGDSFY